MEKSRKLTVPLSPKAAPRPAGYCSWWQECLSFKIRPADHGSVLGRGHNLSISKRPLKRSTVWICTYCSCCLFLFFCSDNNLTGCFVGAFLLSTQRLEVCFILCFGPSCVSCLQDVRLSWVLLCVWLLPTYCETEWSLRLKTVWMAWGWCYMFWWVGLMHTRGF